MFLFFPSLCNHFLLLLLFLVIVSWLVNNFALGLCSSSTTLSAEARQPKANKMMVVAPPSFFSFHLFSFNV
jgi:hypothetical protein